MEQKIDELFDFFLWCYWKNIRPTFFDSDLFDRITSNTEEWPYMKRLTKLEVYARYCYEKIELKSIADIKEAVERGLSVCWMNKEYEVIKDVNGKYLINYKHNNYCIGLTNLAGTELNGNLNEFYIDYQE